MRSGQRLALAIGIDRNHGEFRERAFRHFAALEIGANTDHVALGLYAKVKRFLHGAAAAFAHAHRHAGSQQARGGGQGVDLDGERRLAIVADDRQVGQRDSRGIALLFVGEAELEVREVLPFAGCFDSRLALERQACSGRTIEEAAIDRDVGRFAHRDLVLVAGELELDAIRNEIFHQEHVAGDGGLLGIGVDRNRPGAAHGVRRQRQIHRMAAGSFAAAHHAPVLDAVGACEDEGQRQILDGFRGVVAGKGCNMHGLADAVDAAFGPGINVERARRGAPGNAAVGEVEAGSRHVEEYEILARGVCRQHRRHHAASATRSGPD